MAGLFSALMNDKFIVIIRWNHVPINYKGGDVEKYKVKLYTQILKSTISLISSVFVLLSISQGTH